MGRWRLYQSSLGSPTVSDEINKILSKSAKIRLGALMKRIEEGYTLRQDVKRLTPQISEARLTWEGQEFRLHFARTADGATSVLLALHAVNKKTQKASPQDIHLSEARLRDWEDRHRSA